MKAVKADLQNQVQGNFQTISKLRSKLVEAMDERNRKEKEIQDLKMAHASKDAKAKKLEEELGASGTENIELKRRLEKAEAEVAAAKEAGFGEGYTKANRQCQRLLTDMLNPVFGQGFLAGLEADKAKYAGADVYSCPKFPGPCFEMPEFVDSEEEQEADEAEDAEATGEEAEGDATIEEVTGTAAAQEIAVEIIDSDPEAEAGGCGLKTRKKSAPAEVPVTTEETASAEAPVTAEAPATTEAPDAVVAND
jgi:hypothetical protein